MERRSMNNLSTSYITSYTSINLSSKCTKKYSVNDVCMAVIIENINHKVIHA